MKTLRLLIVIALSTLCAAAQAQCLVRAGATAGPAPAAVAAAPVVLPEAVHTINFESIGVPPLFNQATSLAAVGSVLFNGLSTSPRNGGAVLNVLPNFAVIGYSAPNFLALNCNSAMLDGGVPRMPETIQFPGPWGHRLLLAPSRSTTSRAVTLAMP